VDGTLSGSSPHYDSSDSAFEGQSVLRPKSRSPLTRVFEGYNDQPHSPLSQYSPLQGRMSSSGVIPEMEPEMGSIDMHRNETSSPSSVMEIRGCEEGGDSDSGSGEYYVRDELNTSSPFPVDSVYSSLPYDMHEMKPSVNAHSGDHGVSAANRKILDEIAQVLLGDSSASLSNEQAILLAARMGSMQNAIARDFQTGPQNQPPFDGFPVMDGNYGYYVGRSMGTDNGQVDNNFDTNSRLLKCNTMLDPSFNSVMQCLSKNSSTGDLLMNLPRVASLPQLFESVSQVPLSRYMGIQ